MMMYVNYLIHLRCKVKDESLVEQKNLLIHFFEGIILDIQDYLPSCFLLTNCQLNFFA